MSELNIVEINIKRDGVFTCMTEDGRVLAGGMSAIGNDNEEVFCRVGDLFDAFSGERLSKEHYREVKALVEKHYYRDLTDLWVYQTLERDLARHEYVREE